MVAPGLVRCGHLDLPLDTGDWSVGRKVACSIRPEHIGLIADPSGAGAPAVDIPATVTELERLGGTHRIHLRAGTAPEELAIDLPESDPRLALVAPGRAVRLNLPLHKMQVFEVTA